MGQVVFGDSVVFDGVVNQAAEERDIRPCADLENMSATAAVRVKRGSTTIIFALRVRFASTGHLKPQG